jgi:hypothetical protein
MISLNEKLNLIFDKAGNDLRDHHITISRYDGIVVFTNKTSSDTEAVVTASLWQAAIQLHKTSKIKGSTESFKLCFDSNDQGTIIRSFTLKGSPFYITMSYQETMNPGLLKKKFADFIKELKTQMAMLEVAQPVEVKRDKFLFNKITDKEIEAAFSRIRD